MKTGKMDKALILQLFFIKKSAMKKRSQWDRFCLNYADKPLSFTAKLDF